MKSTGPNAKHEDWEEDYLTIIFYWSNYSVYIG